MRQKPTAKLRQRLAQDRLLVKLGAFGALSAGIIKKQGFEVMGISGYAVSVSLLSKPDAGLILMDDICTHNKAFMDRPGL